MNLPFTLRITIYWDIQVNALKNMDENKERLTSITAYFTPVDIEPILHFFSENKYKLDLNSDKKIDQSDYNLYINEFKSSF